jgi:hypothetical protein
MLSFLPLRVAASIVVPLGYRLRCLLAGDEMVGALGSRIVIALDGGVGDPGGIAQRGTSLTSGAVGVRVWRRSALYLCGMKARSGASKQIASYAIRHIRATR